ncbi:MAG TPA: hypothetical protein VF628_02350 [Allosphingosinicella sp.]|jgi:hypothetical protein
MALPPSYRSADPARTARLPGVDPAAHGAELARGIGAIGQALQAREQGRRELAERSADADAQIAEIEDRRALSSKTADRAAALATGQTALLEKITDLRSTAAPGAAGHEEAVGQLVEQWSTEFMATLDEPRLIEAFTPDVARVAGSMRLGERRFAIEKRADKTVGDFETLQSTLANNVYTDPSPESLATATGLWAKTVGAAVLPDDVKAKYLDAGVKLLRVRGWQGAANRDPVAAVKALDDGALNDAAQGNELIALRQWGVSQIEHREAKTRATQAAQLSGFREQARADIEDVNEGVTVDADRLSAQAAQAAAAGETDLARDLQVAAIKNRVTTKYSGASVPELEEAQRQIEQSGDWRSNRELVAGHDQLGVLIVRTRDRARNDKLSLFSENGGRVSPFDPNDAASWRQRTTEARAAQARYGGPLQVLTEAEAAPLRDQFARGDAGTRADTIAFFAAGGNEAAKAAMRQVAPAQPHFAVLADLATMRDRRAGNQLMREALNGWAQLGANPKLIDHGQMGSDLDREYGAALSMIAGEAREGLLNVAKGIYANRAANGNGSGFDRELWRASFQAALGRAGETGGIVRGRRGALVVVPRGMTGDDLFNTIALAAPREIVTAAGSDAPLWGGKTMSANQLRELTPVMVSDGRYMFRSDTGFARSQRAPSQNFVLDVRHLARLAAGRK